MTSQPQTTSQWTLTAPSGSSHLELQSSVPIPQLGPHDVLVKIHAVSLNSRDIQIANGTYVWGSKPPITPCSDFAGTILSPGTSVTRFQPNDHVAATFHRGWISGAYPTSITQLSQIGAHQDSVLKQHAVFHEEHLVRIPSSLTWQEASCLPCAGVTAWSSLFGGRKGVKPGDAVLVQGSGGVSLFAVQFARAAGAFVVATTSRLGGDREQKLRDLGAQSVVSYLDPDWGAKVKDATPGKRGVDFVVETAGEGEQDGKAVAVGAQIAVVGGKGASGGNVFDMRTTLAEVRKIMVGSREDFESTCRAIEVCGIRPVVDRKTFNFQSARSALEYAAAGKQLGKVVISLDTEID